MGAQIVIIGSEKEIRDFVEAEEKKNLESLRAQLTIESREDADKRMEILELELKTSEKVLIEAYTFYGDDDDGTLDFETLRARAEKVDSIERDFDRLSRLWHTTRKRVAYAAAKN